MSDNAADFASFRELEQLVHSLGEELAGFRKRALSAENRLKALEAANGPADLFSHERLRRSRKTRNSSVDWPKRPCGRTRSSRNSVS